MKPFNAHFRPRLLLAALTLTSTVLAAPLQVFPFRHSAAGVDPAASGRLTVRQVDARTSESVLTLTGLTPQAAYAAHYHALGATNRLDPCDSDGPVTAGFPSFKASAQGRATVVLRADPARIAGQAGAYVNVHTAGDLAVVPLCAAVLRTTTANPFQKPSPDAAPATVKVSIRDNLFSPSSLSVKAGTTVTWTLDGQVGHNVLSVDLPDLHSATLNHGDTFSYTFARAGTFTFYCSFHEGMSATIVVTNR